MSFAGVCFSQETVAVKKVYDESLNPLEQIDKAIVQARNEGKNVICQLGGNWCPWCLRFAAFVENDEELNAMVHDNYVYIHVNVPRSRETSKDFDQRTKYASRFGFPVFVLFDADGNLIHIQDSVFLEEGKGYNKKKVMSFLRQWTCSAVKGIRPQK